ncbi:kinesin-like protein [Nephila pilipes]|uniref:Kinesin-like protein n=1 Tax=Nephila pilipes TaxID=299642 RepID=A0A8X6N9Q5_NEPPI|nr:kinesin-like protein [Nephila pilipes]
MNATSSRAHTIVGITLIQKSRNVKGQETSKTSVVNLVDLAGSERASATGATGDRLKESAAINQSLSCLGNCIHSLAERATGRNVRGNSSSFTQFICIIIDKYIILNVKFH